jgi:hypothetical protein
VLRKIQQSKQCIEFDQEGLFASLRDMDSNLCNFILGSRLYNITISMLYNNISTVVKNIIAEQIICKRDIFKKHLVQVYKNIY